MTPKQFVAAFKKHGSIKAVARSTGIGYATLNPVYHKALAEGLMEKIRTGARSKVELMETSRKGQRTVKKPKLRGRRKALKATPIERHPEKVTRFLFTCAQNNTKIFEPFWESLQTLSKFYHAKIHISRFAYIQGGLGARGDKKNYFAAQGLGRQERDDFWFDERIEPYVSDDRREVAPGLVWCGEANISPTASRPLSGLETFTGRKSGIFPHVRFAMESIPVSETDPVKFNYTTGTVTMRNYIQRKEGLKAEFHHAYGALLVEVDPEGNWWCRQINADSEGTIYDIDLCVKRDLILTNNPAFSKRAAFGHGTFVEGAKWGDIHVEQMDPAVRKAIWGENGILDVLRPKHQFMDDTFDMFARNHHEMDDPHTMLQRYLTGQDIVKGEAERVGEFLCEAHRPWVKTIIVNSNHDRAIMRWLKDKRAQYDPPNRTFWHTMNRRVDNYMEEHEASMPIILRETLLEAMGWTTVPKGWTFLAQGEGFVICPAAGGGIENGQHGDDGKNGSRGSTAGYARMGRKMNKGHDHTAAIFDSVYSGGCCLDLKSPPSYQHGPSSASNSHTITYLNGKRQILTMWGPERKAWADR